MSVRCPRFMPLTRMVFWSATGELVDIEILLPKPETA